MAASTSDLSYTESEQFALNFPIVMAAVSNYMVTEYNEGRLKDVNYATVQAQAIQSAIQTTLTLTMQSDSQKNQAELVAAQRDLTLAQVAEIAPNAAKQRAVQDAQIAQVGAETLYTNSKKTTMEQARIDNLLIEAEKAQMQQLATVGAGGLVPSTNDFDAGNKTRQAVYDRARSGDNTLPIISFSAGTNYTKAT